MSSRYTIAQLAEIVKGSTRGEASAVIDGVADVAEAGPTEATWVSRETYAAKIAASRAGVVLVPKGFPPTPMPAIICERVERSVARLLGAFARPVSRPQTGIHPTAVVDRTAVIGPDAAIGPHVVIEADVQIGRSCALHAGVFVGRGTRIGDDCELCPNVVVRDGCILGHRVAIHPNSVIGADGFGYYFDEGRHNKIPHVGGVRIEDDVEIGSCSCVDRAKFGYTVVAAGTKIDNQVQVAHNCRLGRNCLMVAQSGVAGSVRTGDGCIFGARAASFDNLSIGRGVTIAGIAVVTKNIPDGAIVGGFPAQELRTEMRERAAVRRLPDLSRQIKDLLARVERLEASAHHNP